jgi:hypothetical protein
MAGQTYAVKKYFGWLHWTWPYSYAAVFGMLLLICLLMLDPDFGWHLAAGRYFTVHGIPSTDVFTYTATSFPWVDHEWLSDIIVYRLYTVGGYVSLAVLYAAMWTFSLWLVGRRASGPIVMLAALALLPFAGVRATTWTVLALALSYALIHARQRRLRWLLPPLFLLWANLHGGFIIGLLFAGYCALMKRSLHLAAMTCIGATLTLCNPYGISMYVEIFRTLGDGQLHGAIQEWLPIGTSWQVIPYLALWAVGFVLVRGKRWQSYLGVDVLALGTALAAVRNYPLFIVLSLPTTTTYLGTVLRKIPARLPKNQLTALGGILAGLLVLALWSGLTIYNRPLDREAFFPSQAVAYLQSHPCPGRLFNDFNYGGYILWKLPSTQVYIDGRMPSWTLNGRSYFVDYMRVLHDAQFRQAQFTAYDVRCVLLGYTGETKELTKALKTSGWREVVKTETSSLLQQ